MAAGGDQTEAIIFDLFVIALFVMQGSFVDVRFPFSVGVERKIFLCAVEARASARSKSPRRRTSVAKTRPDSDR